jgi:hypothetical protein
VRADCEFVEVLPVPSQLSLEAGLEEEEAEGRSVLESARIQARRADISGSARRPSTC